MKGVIESAVGYVGRTSKKEAEVFVQNNQDIVKEFTNIVKKIGGKAVAAEILNMNLFGKPSEKPISKFKLVKHPGV